MSINSSIYNFVEENGRTYHKYKEGVCQGSFLGYEFLLTMRAEVYVAKRRGWLLSLHICHGTVCLCNTRLRKTVLVRFSNTSSVLWVAKDEQDLQHQLWLITLHDELQLCPITNPHNVLDIGTGTGIWAIEFGRI